MSLQVWLPLNGNLNNQGLSNVTVTNNGATVDNNGKIGKCYYFNGTDARISDPVAHSYSYPLSCACWIKPSNVSKDTEYIISVNQDTTGSPGHIIGFGFVSGKLCAFVGGVYTPYSVSLSNNVWYHIAVTIDVNNRWILYINGENVQTGVCPNPPAAKWFTVGARSNSSTGGVGGAAYYYIGLINDVRLYDHALSAKEVKELAKGLVLHYPLSAGFGGAENLFRDSYFRADMILGGTSDTSTTLGYYNGAASNHSLANGEDTITLNSSSNIGINFKRLATDINLDTSSYYTISCEAKCTNANAHLDIGLSYCNTSNTWRWRGGANPQNFTAANTWQKFTLTFKPDADTKYIGYCFTCNCGGNHTLVLRHCKLEKGSVATPWTMNSGDVELADIATTEYDVSGYNNHGTKVGTINYSSDSARYAVCSQFNGTNSYIEAEPLPAETKTISIWVKTSWVLPPSGTIRIAVCDKNSGLAIGWGGSTGLMIARAAVSGNGSTCNPTGTYVVNKWNHIVVVKTGDATRNIYINGQLMNTAVNNWWSTDLNKLDIGIRHNGTYSGYFDGQLSDFRAYATVLSAEDVKELYNTAASLANNGTLFAYSFNEV